MSISPVQTVLSLEPRESIREVYDEESQPLTGACINGFDSLKRKVRFLKGLVSNEGYTMDPAEVSLVQALKERAPATVGEFQK